MTSSTRYCGSISSPTNPKKSRGGIPVPVYHASPRAWHPAEEPDAARRPLRTEPPLATLVLDDHVPAVHPALAPLGVPLGVLDDGPGHVDPARALDPLEAGGAVDLEDLGPVAPLQHVDPGDLEPHDLGRGDGGHAVAPVEGDRDPVTAAVKVRPKLPLLCLATHGR